MIAPVSDVPAFAPTRRGRLFGGGATLIVLVAALLAVLVTADAAQARPRLVSSSPENDARVEGGRTMDATLRFDTELVSAGTVVNLHSKAGEQVVEGVPHVSGSSVSVGLPQLLPGDYELRYRVMAVGDDTPVTGRVAFTIEASRSWLAWWPTSSALMWAAGLVACLALGFLIAGGVQYRRQRRS